MFWFWKREKVEELSNDELAEYSEYNPVII